MPVVMSYERYCEWLSKHNDKWLTSRRRVLIKSRSKMKLGVGDVVLINISTAPGSDNLVKGIIDSFWLNGEMANIVIPGIEDPVPFDIAHLAKV